MALGLALPMAKPIQYALGSELLTNGDFGVATNWVLGASWAVASGVATVTNPAATSLLSQAIGLTVGALYRVQYTVTSYTGGGLFVRFTNAGASVTTLSSASATGTYTAYAVLIGTADSLSFVAPNSLASYSIDNVSLKKVL